MMIYEDEEEEDDAEEEDDDDDVEKDMDCELVVYMYRYILIG